MSEPAPGEEEEKLKECNDDDDGDNNSDDAVVDADANAKMKLRNPTTRFRCLLAILYQCLQILPVLHTSHYWTASLPHFLQMLDMGSALLVG